ncbi:SE-cephalotoxin-like [Sphaeramia orbicularis]|uniref:SE-cephalotoxin-like n=1 Tax=Sphaeramia orbicularis TaxID=375764 RepID=UPI00117E28A1|nr:SE-cephalotoxin-like [Sphaeramia orbicularis]
MAFPRMSSIVLSFSLIVFVYWTTSAAESHDLSPADLSALRRIKRALDDTTKERIQSGFQLGVDLLTTVTEVTNQVQPKKLSSVLKGLANFASLAPGIGSLVCSFISVVLAIIPQKSDIEELKNSFSEVNRRLDSLAFQISDLATDVEWFNFASVYSRDETRILNAWMKLDELQQNLRLVTSEEEKLRLAEIFANFYENSGTEGSVANIYHYLTVSGTSLSKNINNLLRGKFKCSISEMGRYNMYLSGLLWKGMVLNQLYWKLIGFHASHKQNEHNSMFKNVFKAQNDSLQFCLDNFEQYLVKDVKEVSTRFTKDQKQDIAANVQKTLDEKYFWYKWAVMVYEQNDEANYKLVHMWRVPVGDVVVGVGYIQKETHKTETREDVVSGARTCFANTQCLALKQTSKDCSFQVRTGDYIGPPLTSALEPVLDYTSFSEFAKVLHYFYRHPPAMSPPPLSNQVECTLDGYRYKVNVYMSIQLPDVCLPDTCWNGGKCRQLMDSNEILCDCPDEYYGKRCENYTSDFQNVDIGSLVPDITTLNTKLDRILDTPLKQIEDKLDQALDTLLKQREDKLDQVLDTRLKQTEDKLDQVLDTRLKQIEDKLDQVLRTHPAH